VLCALVVATTLANVPAAMGIPAQGAVEEFPVLTFYRWSLGDLAPGPEGDIWYLQGSAYYTYSGLVERMTPSGVITGRMELGPNGIGTDIAEGPDKDMWVTVARGNPEEPGAVARITPAEEVQIFTIPDTETLPCCEGSSPGPVAITEGPSGDLWFTDQRSNTAGQTFIASITPSGAITEYPIPTGSAPDLPVASAPAGIALGGDGDIWFTDDGQNSDGQNLVGRISPNGTITEYPIPTKGSDPLAIALGADGDMWFTEPGIDAVGRITPAGEVAEFTVPSVENLLRDIVRGPDGNMWFTEIPASGQEEPALGEITPSGTVKTFALSLPPGGDLENLGMGPEDEIWFADQHWAPIGADGYTYIGRFTVPRVPGSISTPAISGTATAGNVLSSSEGTWSNEPDAFTYQWQQCATDGSDCANVPGEESPRYLLSTGDVGHTLRVAVTAANAGGAATSISAPSPIVVAPAVFLSPPPALAPASTRPSVVGSTTTWRFGLHRGRTTVRSLVLHELPSNALVETMCSGTGCAFAHAVAARSRSGDCHGYRCSVTRSYGSRQEVNLAGLLAPARLKPGARITVIVVKEGEVGKAFEFIVRKGLQPAVHASCRAPGSFTVSLAC
jgi:virginiamycin B lyase